MKEKTSNENETEVEHSPEVAAKKTKSHFVFFAIVLFGSALFYSMSAPAEFTKGGIVTVTPGESIKEIAADLADSGYIRSSFAFTNFVVLFGGEKHLSQGDYYFENPIPVFDVAFQIATGKHNLEPIKITIPEGKTNAEISDIFKEKLSSFDPVVFKKLSDLLTKIDEKDVVLITSPFFDQYKEDIARWYCKHHNIMDLLNNTFSCYNPLEKECTYNQISDNFDPVCYRKTNNYISKHCFNCSACFRRNAVLHNTGISLPFFNKEVLKKYKEEFSSKLGLDNNDKRLIATIRYISYVEECGFVW